MNPPTHTPGYPALGQKDLLNQLQAQTGLVESLQQEKQVLEQAYNQLVAELSNLKAQLADIERLRNQNQELATQVERLGQHLAREILARQNAERALADARAKPGQPQKAESAVPSTPAPQPTQPPPQPLQPLTGPTGPVRFERASERSPVVPSRPEPVVPRPASAPSPEPVPEQGRVANPFLVVHSLLGDLAKPGTGTLHPSVGETLAGMKRSLPYFVRHTNSPEVLEALCQQADFVCAETARSGLLNLHQISTALRLLLHDLRNTPSLVTSANLRIIEHAIDFIFHLLGKENFRKLKDLAPVRMLAVDDEDLVLEILANQLKSIEIDLRTTNSSTQAMPLLKRQRYNLLLLDIAMDEINGLDLCSQIRGLPYYSRTPIVFLTGMKTLDMRAQSSLVGGSDFITKPFHASEIKLKTIYWALKDQMGSC